MKFHRRSRVVAAFITLFSILFMQLAVASYACPALDLGRDQNAPAAVTMADMESCDGIDPDQPSLCHAHSQAGNQSLDKPGAPALQPFLAVGFGLPLAPARATPRPAQAGYDTTFLEYATAPPLAIRHCCFRI